MTQYKTIADLPAADSLNPPDLFEVSQFGTSRRARLDQFTVPPAGPAGGDLSGVYPAPTIKPSVTNGQVMTTVAGVSAWAAPAGGSPSGAAGGDLAGTYPNPTVKSSVGLSGTPTAPTPGAVTSTEIVNAAWVLGKGYTTNSGTVTSASVVSANGLAGTVATATTTPAITLSTTITGMLKGNATAISAAVAGTDYVTPSGLTTTLGSYLPLVGGTLSGPLAGTVSSWTVPANTAAFAATGYSLTGSNTTGAFRITGTLNTTGQPDVFAINITDTSNSGGNAFIIRGGPSGTADLLRTTMSGDTRVAGWCQARLNDALATNGRDYFAYYLGNGSGGNIGLFAGLSTPTFSTFGRYGSIYLDGASPGIPWFNNNGTTGWDRLVGETSTQTLTNKTFAPASISPGSNTQVLTTVSGVTAWATPASGGSVTTVSVVSANGLAGTVATATSTPAITLSTTITGLLKGNGTAISAAVAGTDYVAPASLPLDGYLYKLTMSNSGTTGVIIAAGKCADSTNATLITNSANITKLITATWAAGSAAGGRGTSVSLTASTWYHVFAGMQAGAFDAWIDTSVTGANKPASFTSFRRIGSILTDGSSNILGFVQDGDWFAWTAVILDVNVNSPGTTVVNRAIRTPLGLNVMARFDVGFNNSSTATAANLQVYDPVTTASVAQKAQGIIALATYTQWAAAQVDCRTNTSSQVAVAVGGIGGATVTVTIWTIGWFDTRGRL